MGVNKTNQRLENRVPNAIKELRTEQAAIKTRQLFGGDNIVVGQSTEANGTILIPAGLHVNITVSLQSTSNASNMLPIPYFDLFIGLGHDLDNDYMWPLGASLTNDQKRKFVMFHRLSLYRSNPPTGSHVMPVFIYNQTLTDETVYFHAKFRYPETTVS